MATEQASILEWSDPPEVQRGKRTSKYEAIIQELKANPGKPAKVMENVNSASARVFRDAGLKVSTRTTGNGDDRCDVWAVYDPDGTAGSAAPKRSKKAAAKTRKAPAKKVAAKTPRPRAKRS